MNLENSIYGKELYAYLLGDAELPARITSKDLRACKAYVGRYIKELEHEAFKKGSEAQRKAEGENLEPPSDPFSPYTDTLEGAKTLLNNIGSTVLVGLMFQFFVPYLSGWPSALIVLEIVRGPLKVGGDFAVSASRARHEQNEQVRIPRQAQLGFTLLYTFVMALFSVGIGLFTQLFQQIVTQLNPDWLELTVMALLAFIGGYAFRSRGFGLLARYGLARASWRSATKFAFLFTTATVGVRLAYQLLQAMPFSITIVWFDLAAAFVLTFICGCVAIYAQAFCIVPWVWHGVPQLKRARWLTTARSYTRMVVNIFLPFLLSTSGVQLIALFL